MSNNEELVQKLLDGPIPLELLLHLQQTAGNLEHGTIELVFTGKGSGIDVITKNRTRFK